VGIVKDRRYLLIGAEALQVGIRTACVADQALLSQHVIAVEHKPIVEISHPGIEAKLDVLHLIRRVTINANP